MKTVILIGLLSASFIAFGAGIGDAQATHQIISKSTDGVDPVIVYPQIQQPKDTPECLVIDSRTNKCID